MRYNYLSTLGDSYTKITLKVMNFNTEIKKSLHFNNLKFKQIPSTVKAVIICVPLISAIPYNEHNSLFIIIKTCITTTNQRHKQRR